MFNYVFFKNSIAELVQDFIKKKKQTNQVFPEKLYKNTFYRLFTYYPQNFLLQF